MVEKNNQSAEHDYQALQQSLLRNSKGEQVSPEGKTSTGKKIGIVALLIVGVAIAIPFLLFITCLGIVAISN